MKWLGSRNTRKTGAVSSGHRKGYGVFRLSWWRASAPFALALALAVSAMAGDINGKWKAKFDTQIGEQHYTYQFKADGEKLTGTAANDMGSTEIKEGTIKGDDVSFVENLDFNGTAIRIEYTGKIAGDEIKFTRKVGDFATEDLVAKRDK